MIVNNTSHLITLLTNRILRALRRWSSENSTSIELLRFFVNLGAAQAKPGFAPQLVYGRHKSVARKVDPERPEKADRSDINLAARRLRSPRRPPRTPARAAPALRGSLSPHCRHKALISWSAARSLDAALMK
ncbi:hypothetical protein EVAR_97481_1 [Eumeta japonica]|uniref:Uncharacterized protein n=1 Tax=Eumeta variegata TaxID=151549 RepID=A0A4C1Z828_EUMVA|nr:hypothetical protein EVAR_97481_1 [Eumeta japonica]